MCRPKYHTFSTILTSAPTDEFRRVRHSARDYEYYKNIMLKTLSLSRDSGKLDVSCAGEVSRNSNPNYSSKNI
jgi:hypothetical protein